MFLLEVDLVRWNLGNLLSGDWLDDECADALDIVFVELGAFIPSGNAVSVLDCLVQVAATPEAHIAFDLK